MMSTVGMGSGFLKLDILLGVEEVEDEEEGD